MALRDMKRCSWLHALFSITAKPVGRFSNWITENLLTLLKSIFCGKNDPIGTQNCTKSVSIFRDQKMIEHGFVVKRIATKGLRAGRFSSHYFRARCGDMNIDLGLSHVGISRLFSREIVFYFASSRLLWFAATESINSRTFITTILRE